MQESEAPTAGFSFNPAPVQSCRSLEAKRSLSVIFVRSREHALKFRGLHYTMHPRTTVYYSLHFNGQNWRLCPVEGFSTLLVTVATRVTVVECIGLIAGAERENSTFRGKARVCLQAIAPHTPRAAETAEELNVKENTASDFRV